MKIKNPNLPDLIKNGWSQETHITSSDASGVKKKKKMSKLLSWNSDYMSLVWDLRSRLSHLKDILFGLEAMEAKNSLCQHSPHRRQFNESSKCWREKTAHDQKHNQQISFTGTKRVLEYFRTKERTLFNAQIENEILSKKTLLNQLRGSLTFSFVVARLL